MIYYSHKTFYEFSAASMNMHFIGQSQPDGIYLLAPNWGDLTYLKTHTQKKN